MARGKDKLRRFAENLTFRCMVQPEFEEVFRTDFRLKGRWREDFFGNPNPVVLELGCGRGEYTVSLAERYPDKNFIGVDIKGARMWRGAKTATEQEMRNAGFLRTRIEFIDSCFAPGEVDEIWITFPDPQMAKARKRLTGTRFLSLYKKMLKEDGIIHLKTDSPFLYQYTAELIRLNGLTAFVNTDDLYASGLDDKILGIKTFYEQQWLSRGKQIKYLKFTLSDSGELIEPDIDIEKDDYHSEARFMNK